MHGGLKKKPGGLKKRVVFLKRLRGSKKGLKTV